MSPLVAWQVAGDREYIPYETAFVESIQLVRVFSEAPSPVTAG